MEWMLMPLRRYADFSGRSRRMGLDVDRLQLRHQYRLLDLLVALGGAAIMAGASDPTQMMAVGGVVMILYLLYVLVGSPSSCRAWR